LTAAPRHIPWPPDRSRDPQVGPSQASCASSVRPLTLLAAI